MTDRDEAQDGSILARREVKFVFPGADPGAIGEILAGSARRLVYGDSPVSRVSSIYLDDASLTACRESLSGIGRRTKVRLRWYDRPLPAETAWFEIKTRKSDLIWKQRSLVRSERGFGSMDYSELVDAVAAQVSEAQAAYLRGRDQPTVLVSYRREHFGDAGSGMRVTLDYDIDACDQTGCRGPARGIASSLEGLVIVEVKAGKIDPVSLRQLLHPLAPRRARASKYVLSCQSLGWLDIE